MLSRDTPSYTTKVSSYYYYTCALVSYGSMRSSQYYVLLHVSSNYNVGVLILLLYMYPSALW